MMELKVLDLLQGVAWGIGAVLPILSAFYVPILSNRKHEAFASFLFVFVLVSQISLLVFAYKAGGVH